MSFKTKQDHIDWLEKERSSLLGSLQDERESNQRLIDEIKARDATPDAQRAYFLAGNLEYAKSEIAGLKSVCRVAFDEFTRNIAGLDYTEAMLQLETVVREDEAREKAA